MFRIATLVAAVTALFVPSIAAGHSPLHGREHVTVSQLKAAVKHHKYVAHNGKGHARMWHKKAIKWTLRSIRKREPARPRIDYCLHKIIDLEGSDWDPRTWNPRLTNPSSGAYGVPQALPGSKMASAGADWATNVWTQVKWMLGYVRERYGSSCNALAFWYRNHYY